MLTFELTPDNYELEIHGDSEGLSELMEVLSRLVDNSGHEHLMTAAWGGTELSAEKQGSANTLINKVTIRSWVNT